MGAGEEAAAGQVGQQGVEAGLGGQVEGGGRPSRRPLARRCQTEPPSSARVSPSSQTSRPGRGKPAGTAVVASSSRPRTPTIGVGWMGRPDDSL